MIHDVCPACGASLNYIVVSVDAAGQPIGGAAVWLRASIETRWKLKMYYSQRGIDARAALWYCADCGENFVAEIAET